MRLLACVLWVVFFVQFLMPLPVVGQDYGIAVLLDKAEANMVIDRSLTQNILADVEQLIESGGDQTHLPRLLNLQAHLAILASDFSRAFALAKEAEVKAHDQGIRLQLAEAVRRQGIINFFLGFDATAIELLTESLVIHQELDSDYVLNNLQSIGNVYGKSASWSDALIEIGELLVEKAITKNKIDYEDEGYSFIASGLIKKGELRKAKLVTEQARKALSNKSKNISYYAAKIALQLGDYEEALLYVAEYREFARKHSTTLTELAADLLEAEILHAVGARQKYLNLMLSSLDIADKISVVRYQEEALQKLANYFQEEGEYQTALVYFQRLTELKEKEFSNKQAKQLAFSRARLELEHKNQKITELELTTELVTQQNQYQLFTILLIGSITILLLGLYWRLSGQRQLLLEQSAQLKQAVEAKSQFLARMSHEIRTPINAIIGLTKLTQKQQLTVQQQQVNLQQIEDSSSALLGVINDILDFSKIEAGKLNIESLPFEIEKVVNQATRLQALKVNQKGLELVQYIAHDVPLCLRGDALRVQQVLNNLISNAVKFTPKGVISVSLNRKYSESGVLLEFAVKDTGIGISEEQISRLFTSFSQADESTTRKFGGTGLGLAICKQLVELMGGQIWVESRLGQGSTFYFSILTEAEVRPQPKSEVSGIELSDLRVLVVDDVELCRQAAAEVLLRVNINPDLVDSGAAAIEKVRLSMHDNAPYDLILLDWKMPDIDGIEVASIINQEFSAAKPRIAMLSAHEMQSLQELSKPLGVESFLEKPINTSSLIEMITEVTHAYKVNQLTPEPTMQEALNLSHLKILLVEDNSLNLKVAMGFLAETQVQLTVAENGQIALKILAQQPNAFDLVLMDVQMPIMDGYVATQKIRNELGLTLPVVAMTANAMKTDIEKCFAAGMDAHVPKPIDPLHLTQVLKQVLADKVSNSSTADTPIANTSTAARPELHQQTDDIDSDCSALFAEDIPNLNGKRLLLVEDNRLDRKVAIRFLTESDVHISVAKTGEDAIRLLTDEPDGYDLVFINVQMPGMDGIATTRFIRKELGLEIPIIAMTAATSNEEIQASLTSGMNAHVTKPINSSGLYNAIVKVATDSQAALTAESNVLEVSAEKLAVLIKVDKPRALAKLNGNKDLYYGLVQDFIAMEPQIKALSEALEQQDFKRIKLIVHTFKSGLAYIGANNLSELGKQIELDIQKTNGQLTPALLSALHTYQHAIIRLNATLQKH